MKRPILILFITMFIPLISVNAHIHGDCPVSGDSIDHSTSLRFNYTGIEYELCSERCMAEFKEEPILYLEKALCIPCNDDDAKPELVFIHEDVKYYFCNQICLEKFSANTNKYLSKFEEEK